MKDLAEHFSRLGKNKKEILVLGHPHADPDAVGSVIGLAEILESLGAKIITGIPTNLSKLSKNVLKSTNSEIQTNPPVKGDSVIILDTSSLDQLEDYEEKIKDLECEIIFIDHHRPDEKTKEKIDMHYSDEEVTSTAELIIKLGKELEHKFESKTALLLLAGIISDTGHLKFANENTFKGIIELLDSGAKYREALDLLKTPDDPSKRIAMLKAAQRLELHKAYGRHIAFSEVGAYESDAASMFIKIGADVAAVASDNEEIRVSSRSRSGLASETNLHLGELMSKLADYFDGTGGGHAGAAAMTAQAEFKEVKKKIIKELKKMMKPI